MFEEESISKGKKVAKEGKFFSTMPNVEKHPDALLIKLWDLGLTN